MKRKWDVNSDDVRKKCIDEIISFFDDLDSTKIGIIAAEELLVIITNNLGPDMYNKGIEDAKKLLGTKFQDFQIDLDLLEQKY